MIDDIVDDGSALEELDGTSGGDSLLETEEVLETTDGDGGEENGSTEPTWDGRDPLELPLELRGAYENMNRGYQAKLREEASKRKSLEEGQAGLDRERAEVATLLAKLRQETAATNQPQADGTTEGESLLSPTELRQRLADAPSDGAARFEILLSEFDRRADQRVRQATEGINAENANLKERLERFEKTARPREEAERFNQIFDDMKGSSHRVFANEDVKKEMISIFQGDDPSVQYLMGQGTDESTRAALALAGAQAVRTVESGRRIRQRKRASDGNPLNGKRSPGTTSKLEGPPVGEGNWLHRVQSTLRKPEHKGILDSLGLDKL